MQSDRRGDHHARLQRATPGVLGSVARARDLLGIEDRGGLTAGEGRRWRAAPAQRALDGRDPCATRNEAGGQQREHRQQVPEARRVVFEVLERGLQDRLTMAGDIHEDEREDPDREHRQPDPQPVVDASDPPHREADVDREPGDRAKSDCLAEAHCCLPFPALRRSGG